MVHIYLQVSDFRKLIYFKIFTILKTKDYTNKNRLRFIKKYNYKILIIKAMKDLKDCSYKLDGIIENTLKIKILNNNF